MDQRRNEQRRRRRPAWPVGRSNARRRPSEGYAVAPPLAFAADRISSISVVRRRPTAAAAALPAALTALPARLRLVALLLVKPCSARAARAAVAATATSSAISGL